METTHHPEPTYLRRQPFRERSSLIAMAFALLVSGHLVTAPNGHAQDSASEYQVKAAYLFNFLKFVEWPEEAFTDPLAPIVIGIAGDDPFGNALPQVVVGKNCART
jgi:hypothetical protein